MTVNVFSINCKPREGSEIERGSQFTVDTSPIINSDAFICRIDGAKVNDEEVEVSFPMTLTIEENTTIEITCNCYFLVFDQTDTFEVGSDPDRINGEFLVAQDESFSTEITI